MFTYMSGILSTIERVFGLRSEYSAYVMSGNEISQFLLIFFVPCITRIKRRPLWVGLGMMLSVLGCFFISMASFTTSNTSHHWVRTVLYSKLLFAKLKTHFYKQTGIHSIHSWKKIPVTSALIDEDYSEKASRDFQMVSLKASFLRW